MVSFSHSDQNSCLIHSLCHRPNDSQMTKTSSGSSCSFKIISFQSQNNDDGLRQNSVVVEIWRKENKNSNRSNFFVVRNLSNNYNYHNYHPICCRCYVVDRFAIFRLGNLS